MLSARPSRLALTAVGLVVAAAIGVQLGQSAISEINPVHFQGPLAPQGITPPPEPAPFNPYGQPYVWSMNPQPMIVDCQPDCDGGRARQAMSLALDEPAGRDPSLPYWRDATPATELQPWAPGQVAGQRQVERYLHYPVDREEAARTQVQGQAAPAAETPAPAPTAVAPGAEALRPPPATPEPVVRE